MAEIHNADNFPSTRQTRNTRLVYSQHYEDGSLCSANSKPRRTQVDFYCDNYNTSSDGDELLRVLDISELDWCHYHFKVSTRYMCTGVTQLPKASIRKNAAGGARSRLQRSDVDLSLDTLDEGHAPVLKRKVRCKVQEL